MLIIWPTFMYWMPNHYSGWSQLRQHYAVADDTLTNSQGRTHVSLISASGRKYNFESSGSGRASYARTEVGLDDESFWIRGVHGGWTGGPQGAVRIPWEKVKTCNGLRITLNFPEISLIIHDQRLLDQCAQHR